MGDLWGTVLLAALRNPASRYHYSHLKDGDTEPWRDLVMCPRTCECSGPEPESPESEQTPQKSPGPGHTPTWFTLSSVQGWRWHAALWWPHNIHGQQRKWSVGARGRELLAMSPSVIFSPIPIYCLLQKPTGTFTFQTDNFTHHCIPLLYTLEFLAFTDELHC